MNKKVKKALRWFFLGKTDSKPLKVINFLASLFVVYFLPVWFAPGIFFRNSYTTGNITFKCAAYSRYDGWANATEFHKVCDEAMEAISHSELYNANTKICILFCTGGISYKLLLVNPFENSIGFKRTLTPSNIIIINKLTSENMTSYRGEKENNARKLPSILTHEATHVFAQRGGLVTFFTPSWKEEGICEYVAADSSYPVQEGWQHFLAREAVKSHSYDYLLYRVAVTYLHEVEGLTFPAIVADRRTLQEVLDGARKHVQESGSPLF